jgi:molybdate transport system substrate-binding protein
MISAIGRIAAGLLLAQVAAASAADLKVYSTIGVQLPFEELAAKFEKATGHKLDITWATAAILVRRIQAGESADLLILTRQSLEALAKAGKASLGPDATFASSGMALVVRQGAPKPDISTPEAFKQALLKAKTVAYSNPAAGGASGVYFAGLIERMGIADQIKAKALHPPPSGMTGALVASGEAELAVQMEPEVMSVAGVEIVGPWPAEINNIVVYAAGIGSGSKEADAAGAVIKFLHSPEAASVFKAKGLSPIAAP